jgi:hypothetical protein
LSPVHWWWVTFFGIVMKGCFMLQEYRAGFLLPSYCGEGTRRCSFSVKRR